LPLEIKIRLCDSIVMLVTGGYDVA